MLDILSMLNVSRNWITNSNRAQQWGRSLPLTKIITASNSMYETRRGHMSWERILHTELAENRAFEMMHEPYVERARRGVAVAI